MIVIIAITLCLCLLGINLIWDAIANKNQVEIGLFKLLGGIFILSFALTIPYLIACFK